VGTKDDLNLYTHVGNNLRKLFKRMSAEELDDLINDAF